MEYQIEDTDQAIDWIPVFETISARQFDRFADCLGFPILVTPELRQIAKQFCLATVKYFSTSNPDDYKVVEEPESPLYLPSSDVYGFIQILNNTFKRLQAAGYAAEVYDWGQRMFALENLSRTTLSSQWQDVIIRWIPHPRNDNNLPPLPPEGFGRLHQVAVQYATDSQALRLERERVGEAVLDRYERSGILGAMFEWVRYTLELSMWKQLFAILTSEELEILDQWGEQLFEERSLWGYFSLVEFRREIM